MTVIVDIPFAMMERACRTLASELGRWTVEQREFQEKYKCLVVGSETRLHPSDYTLVFENEGDMTMFMLRWS